MKTPFCKNCGEEYIPMKELDEDGNVCSWAKNCECKEDIRSVNVDQRVMQLPDYLEKTIEGRQLLSQITFLLAETFQTHPEKIAIETVCELIKIIRQSA